MINIYFYRNYVIVADLNTSNSKASSLLYLREDRIKISLNNFFEANRIFEKEIFNNLDDEELGIADIRCLLIINLNPGIIFNELLNPSFSFANDCLGFFIFIKHADSTANFSYL